MTTNKKEYRERLFDDQRSLPSYLTVLNETIDLLKKDSALGIIYIDGKELRAIEVKYGSQVFDEVMINLSKLLSNMRGTIIRRGDILALNRVKGYSFLIFMSESRKERQNNFLSKAAVEKTCERVQNHLQSTLFFQLYDYLQGTPKINIGYSFVVYNPMIDPVRSIYTLIEEAREIAELQTSQNELKNRGRLQKVILEAGITTVYQPIVNLKDISIMGFESLTRGPQHSEIEAPVILFRLAEETGLIFELDRLCRRQAIINAKGKTAKLKLFVNTLPNLTFKPDLEAKRFVSLLERHGIPAEDVVFEITERNAIEKYSNFRQALKFYTDAGIQIAIDDVGAGYSSLEAIMEINPTYVKIDASIIRGAAQNPVKQEMLKALQTLSISMKASTIAEGIETMDDFQMVKKLNITYGQGYLFAKPGKPFPVLNNANYSLE